MRNRQDYPNALLDSEKPCMMVPDSVTVKNSVVFFLSQIHRSFPGVVFESKLIATSGLDSHANTSVSQSIKSNPR